MKAMILFLLKIILYHGENKLNKVSDIHTLLAMEKIEQIQVCNFKTGCFVYKMNIKPLPTGKLVYLNTVCHHQCSFKHGSSKSENNLTSVHLFFFFNGNSL